MTKYADLEISLHHAEALTYSLDFRFIDPDSETDVSLEQGRDAYATFDFQKFAGLVYEPEAYGKMLSDCLFADSAIRSAFDNARVRVSATEDKALRFRLLIGANAPELHQLHWETLRNPQDSSPLCTDENLVFSRYLSSFDWRPVRLQARGNLSALVVIANPSDLAKNKLAAIDYTGELQRARQALGEISVSFLPEPDGTEHATLDNIMKALRGQEYDILYLVMHGALLKIDQGGIESDKATLWLEDAGGKTSYTSGTEFATRLNELPRRPRLVVLASCESAGNDEGHALSAIGPRLAEAGIPAVLAMQGKVSMQTVAEFMPAFFTEMQRDGMLDRAMAVARGVVRTRPDYWMPVLFMRLKSGRIWYVPGFGEGREFHKWNALIAYIKDKACTPILGPGLFEPLLGSLGDIAQGWAETFHYPLSPGDLDSLPRIAQYLTINQSPQFPYQHFVDFGIKAITARFKDDLPSKLLEPFAEPSLDDFIDAIGKARRNRHPDDAYKLLVQLPFRIYVTTNWNSLLESALVEAGREPKVAMSPWNEYTEDRIRAFDPLYEPTVKQPLVYYLFGRLAEPKSVVLTEDNYFDYLLGVSRNNDLIPAYVRNALRNTSLLFIGFRMEEWNFRVLFRSVIDKKTAIRNEFVHMAAQIEPEEGRIIDPDGARRYLEEYFTDSASVNLYWGTAEEFVKELMNQWVALR
ncbi:MAG TPA: CHAT domain-containing protein [Anaerolineales bacterium]